MNCKVLSFVANFDLDDDFLQDPKYTEVFKETYLRPIEGHRVFAIQPGINISIFTVFVTSFCIFPDVVACCNYIK